jgi:ADP-ribose diphosphatase
LPLVQPALPPVQPVEAAMTHRANGNQPEILSVRTAARSRLFHIEAVELRFANGSVREFERVAGSAQPGAVIIVPLLDRHNLLLVREYAVGLERYELNLPMGRVQHGETTLEAANRELREETGYAARSLRTLYTLALAPGILGYQMEVVLATGLFPSTSAGDEPEPLEVVGWPVNRVDELVIREGIADARTLAALFIARQSLPSGG